MRGRVAALGIAIAAAGGAAAGVVVSGESATRRAGPRAHAVPAPGVPARGTTSAKPSHVNVLATLPASGSRCEKAQRAAPEPLITHREWVTGVTITEYYPVPERWFTARRISAPGLAGTYAADWLYSARGLAMEGSGVDRFGRPVHIADLGSTGWVNAAGRPTVPVCLGKWSNGFPVWLIGGWRNARGGVTFPLAAGGWAGGPGVRTRGYGGVTFATGSALPLRYYRSVAVDPKMIPLGSRVYVPAYKGLGGGWFIAQDTGGAIRGRHIDVYRPPPAGPDDLGRYMTSQRILVVPPGRSGGSG